MRHLGFSLILKGNSRDVAQLGRASALGAEGRRFESSHPDSLVQLSPFANISKGFLYS
jgi:hypothetical protein